ncbi:DUF4305 domain-containing protein [Alteribacillus sp. HJP-4]|uniref:DUF4305 domain-containing protein n=1 Tax=Alteribacillus sp. HJP-4 TaxID=2775394 RepID=UPI0035CD3131
MRMSPSLLGMIYFALAGLFIYLAIQQVSTESWGLMAVVFAAVAAVDIMMGIRYFRVGSAAEKKDNNKK